MNGLTRIHKNSIFITISTFSRLVTNALIFVIIARYYGPESFGSFTTAYTLTMVFLLLGDFGFDLLITTEIARKRDNVIETITRYYPIKLIFTFLAFCLLIFASLIIPSSSSTRNLVFILSFNMVFTTITNFYFAIFRGIEQFQHEAKITFTINLLLLIGAFLFSEFKLEIIVIAILIVIARLLGLIMALLKIKSVLNITYIKLSFKNIKNEIIRVSSFGLEILFAALYFQIDTVLLNSIKGESVAGIYQSAFRLLVILLIIPDIIAGAIIPTITRMYAKGDIKWKKLGKLFFKILFLVSLPIMLITFEYSKQILEIVYNRRDFLSANFILKIAAIIVFIRFCAQPFSIMLTINENQWKKALIAFLAFVINLTLNLIFIPMYGATGAIIISLITNVIACLLYILFTYPLFFNWALDKKFGIPILIIITSGYFISTWNNISIWIITPVLMVVFFSISVLINFTSDERSLLFYLKSKI